MNKKALDNGQTKINAKKKEKNSPRKLKKNPIYCTCSLSTATYMYAITLNIATTTATTVIRATTRQLILTFDFK